MLIDYGKIATALAFYEAREYERVRVPWTCSPYYNDLTRPPRVAPHYVVGESEIVFTKPPTEDVKTLLGSAEQSFLELMGEDSICKGLYVAESPCFRRDASDAIHQKEFFKVELFAVRPSDPDETLQRLLSDAECFFKTFGLDVRRHLTSSGTDLVAHYGGNYIELGSYRIGRNEIFGRWVCGTGCAEPRLSTVIHLDGQTKGDE